MPRSRWSIRMGGWLRSRIGMPRTMPNVTCGTGWRDDRVGALAAVAGRAAVAGVGAATAAARDASHDDLADAGPDSAARDRRLVAAALVAAEGDRRAGGVEPEWHQRNRAGLACRDGLDAAADDGCFAGHSMDCAGEVCKRAVAGWPAARAQLAACGVRGARGVPARGHRDGVPVGLAVPGFAGAVVQQLPHG